MESPSFFVPRTLAGSQPPDAHVLTRMPPSPVAKRMRLKILGLGRCATDCLTIAYLPAFQSWAQTQTTLVRHATRAFGSSVARTEIVRPGAAVVVDPAHAATPLESAEECRAVGLLTARPEIVILSRVSETDSEQIEKASPFYARYLK